MLRKRATCAQMMSSPQFNRFWDGVVFSLAQLDWRRFQLVAIFGGVGRRQIMIIPASALPRPSQRRRLVRFT